MMLPFLRVSWLSYALAACGAVCAQSFPSKPIRILTAEVGGGNDFVARAIQPALVKSLGQQVVIENRGVVAASLAAKAPADGYTVLFFGASLWIAPLFQDLPWDAEKDFTPVTLAVSFPNILVVHPSVPVKSVKELIALAKARPGELNYSSGATAGASPFLAAELFKAMTGVNIVRVNYRGGGQAVSGLISGEVHVMFPNAGSVAHHMKTGRVRALAITTAKPSALAPGLPTVGQTVPGYESTAAIAVFAPAKTPVPIVSRLHEEIAGVLHQQYVKARFFENGTEVVASSPAELAATMRADITTWTRVIRENKLRAP